MTSEQEKSENFNGTEYELEGRDFSESDNANEIVFTEVENEDFSRLGDSSEDPDQKRCYIEYLTLIKDIKCQNQIINNIKEQIKSFYYATLKKVTEREDKKCLCLNLRNEIKNLDQMIIKAMKLQNWGSHRHYHDLPLATTLDEDNIKCLIENSMLSNVKNMTNKTKFHEHEQNKVGKRYGNKCHDCSTCLSENNSLRKLKNKLNCMQILVSNLKKKFSATNKNLKSAQNFEKTKSQGLCCQDQIKPTNIQNSLCVTEKSEILKENYLNLLSEYIKKDVKLKYLERRLNKEHSSKSGTGSIFSVEENLKDKISNFKGKLCELKCVMVEQSQRLENYRVKYLEAQQKVEEQNKTLDRLNITNKTIQNQINDEMNTVRKEFQIKIKELLRYPKLLENVRLKLRNTYKEKENIQERLIVICKELKSLKMQNTQKNDNTIKTQILNCQSELVQVKSNIEKLEKLRDGYYEDLQTTRTDLDSLRSESAKIIASMKERTEMIRKSQEDQIICLEKELALCRSQTSRSVTDREGIIREMQAQLNVLSQKFNSAQRQINILKNHIEYITREFKINSCN